MLLCPSAPLLPCLPLPCAYALYARMSAMTDVDIGRDSVARRRHSRSSYSVLPRSESNPPALVHRVGLHGHELGIVQRQRLSFQGIHDAPVDHVAKQHHAAELHLLGDLKPASWHSRANFAVSRLELAQRLKTSDPMVRGGAAFGGIGESVR